MLLCAIKSIKAGSTCCLGLLTDNIRESQSTDASAYSYLTVAWCGDTQLCLVRNGRVCFMSTGHKPESDDERVRIEKTGATVSLVNGVYRINGYLSVARAFGTHFVFLVCCIDAEFCTYLLQWV